MGALKPLLCIETLSDRGKPGVDGNRATRKSAYNEKIRQGSSVAHAVTAADLISNSHSIAKYDPKFSKTYFKEKGETLAVIHKAHPTLLKAAHHLSQKGWLLILMPLLDSEIMSLA